MFGWFKKKDTKTKILEQYKKELDNLKSIEEKVESNTELMTAAKEVVFSNLEVIGELYATTVKGKETVEITLKDIDKQTNLVDKLLTPIGHFSREIEFTGNVSLVDNLIKLQPDSYVVDSFDGERDYSTFNRVIKKRDTINKSKLNSKLKKLYNEKVLERRYRTEVIAKFSPMLGESVLEWLEEYNFENVTFSEIESYKFLEDVYYVRQDSKPWQTIVRVPYSQVETLVSNKYYKHMLKNNKLSMAYHKGL